MAVAQRSYSAAVVRPAARPHRPIRRPTTKATPIRRPARVGVRVSVAALVRPMVPAVMMTTLLVGYLYGHAQMTQASYFRVKLQKAEQGLRTEQNALIVRKNEKTGKDTVELWAESHGFIKPQTPPIVLQYVSREGR